MSDHEMSGRWISAAERLPEARPDAFDMLESDRVLVVWADQVEIARYCPADERGGAAWIFDDDVVVPSPVTHWMPLPKRPADDLQEPEATQERGANR